MKHIKTIALAIILLGFIGIGIATIRNNAQELEVKKLELKSKQSELIKLNSKYDEVIEQKTKTEQEKLDQIKKIEQLEAERKRLEAELQAKKDRQEAERQRIAVTPVAQASSGSQAEWLYKLRMCESGGNYAINTGNGFYGAYQFMQSTWNNIARMSGKTHLIGVQPNVASPADQDAMIVYNTNVTQGLVTQNPGCYKKLGLSNKPPL